MNLFAVYLTVLGLPLLFWNIVGEQPSSRENDSCILPDWNNIPEKERPSQILQDIGNCAANLLRCYCLTPTNTSTVSPTNVSYSLGRCIEGCFIANQLPNYYSIYFNNSGVSLCYQFNRMGSLCGICRPGYGPAVYSFSLVCVECPDIPLWKRLFLYILIAYGPLTLFLAVIVVFTISTNSTPLQGWIFACQIIACSFYMRVLTRMAEIGHMNQYFYRVIGSLYGIWNLDFLRAVYKPFCLHQNLNTLQAMSLDFAIAAYPLVVILILYLLVDMYSHNYWLLVIMWRPFHTCCLRFRHKLNIKTSLVDAFGTFFSLSFVKMFCTAVDVLTFSLVWEDTNKMSYQPYFQGGTLYFQDSHLPLAILSIFLVVTFNFLPLLLLLLYSIPKTQFCIHFLPRPVQNILFPFMDNILSCYKDGTNGTLNCRYFAVIYHTSRIIIFSIVMATKNTICYPLTAMVVVITVLLLALIRPYKSALFNALDIFFLASVALGLLGSTTFFFAHGVDPRNESISIGIIVMSAIVPLFCISGYLGYRVWRWLSLTRCLQVPLKTMAGILGLPVRWRMKLELSESVMPMGNA